MITNFLEIFVLLKNPLLLLFLSLFILSFFWIPIFEILKLKEYYNIQRVHKSEVSRLGGLLLYLFFWIIYFFEFFNNQLLLNILLSSIPFIIIGIIEDIFHCTSPNSRLFNMLIGCLIFFYINPLDFPIIDFPYLGQVISYYPIGIIFFTFSIIVVMNGMNLIDGMNGLFCLSALTILIALSFLATYLNDYEIVKLCIVFSLPLLCFLIFNFPFGKIFIGDLGAYFYGFCLSIVTIKLFGKHNELLTWIALILLIYPSFELLFSFIRKFKSRISPLSPDNLHLHSLLNKYLFFLTQNYILSNSFTTIFLFFFWLIPPIIAISINQVLFLFLFLSFYVLFYFYFYNFIKRKLNYILNLEKK